MRAERGGPGRTSGEQKLTLDVSIEPIVGLDFELAITGCDVFGSIAQGPARVDDAGVWLLPPVGTSTFGWPNDVSFEAPVPSVLLKPQMDGGLLAASEAGASSWSVGLNCGCGVDHACGCQDPFK